MTDHRRRTDLTLREFIMTHPYTTGYIAVAVTVNLALTVYGLLT